jgi:hypothetical protein
MERKWMKIRNMMENKMENKEMDGKMEIVGTKRWMESWNKWNKIL